MRPKKPTDTPFYNCTSIHDWLLSVESLRQLVAPKDRVIDGVSMINVWMPSNRLLLKYSRIACEALELGQYLVNEWCQQVWATRWWISVYMRC